MELINQTNQVQSIELIDGSCKSCMPNKSIHIKQGSVRDNEFKRALKFFNIVQKQQAVRQPINTVSEPIQANKSNKEVTK